MGTWGRNSDRTLDAINGPGAAAELEAKRLANLSQAEARRAPGFDVEKQLGELATPAGVVSPVYSNHVHSGEVPVVKHERV